MDKQQNNLRIQKPTLANAIALAASAHSNQLEKSGKAYILHPIRVMQKMNNETEMIVAILHDVVEDTPITLSDLERAGYSSDIIEAVDCLSRRKSESYDQFIQRLIPNKLARKVKIADLEDNMDVKRLVEFGEKDKERLAKYFDVWKKLKNLEGM